MIKLGILGYGNLGRAVIDNLPNFPDMRLDAIFTRRPQAVKADYPVYAADKMSDFAGKLDVVILCGGSATDLPRQTPEAATMFNVVDSFDTHAKIPAHFAAVERAAEGAGKLALISAGWDPGLFSLARAMFGAFLPKGTDYTFWGKGVSQGHSDAIRRIAGVKRGVQYTIPKQDALTRVREGGEIKLSTRDKHLRECFVVAEDGADKAKIEKEIVTMPNYFADYDTVVHFIDERTFERDHKGIPHGGFVLRSGKSTEKLGNLLELSIKLDSNPHFTSGILLAYARAVSRLSAAGLTGCLTPFDVPLSALYEGTPEDMRKNLL